MESYAQTYGKHLVDHQPYDLPSDMRLHSVVCQYNPNWGPPHSDHRHTAQKEYRLVLHRCYLGEGLRDTRHKSHLCHSLHCRISVPLSVQLPNTLVLAVEVWVLGRLQSHYLLGIPLQIEDCCNLKVQSRLKASTHCFCYHPESQTVHTPSQTTLKLLR